MRSKAGYLQNKEQKESHRMSDAILLQIVNVP